MTTRAEEIAWETEGIERGIARYRKAVEETDLPETDPGQTLMREVLSSFIPAIERAQEEAAQGLEGKKGPGRPPVWYAPIISLEAEKIAVITVRTLLTMDPLTTSGAIAIGSRIKEQREFDLWKSKQAERRGEDPKHVDLYKLMLSRVKKVDARTARKWMRLSTSLDRLDWTSEVKSALGQVLMHLLVTNGGGWFEAALSSRAIGRRRITEKRVVLTEAARTFIEEKHAQSELTRPWLLPMIAPPQPWRKK